VSAAYYIVRYLPPKAAGFGEIAFAFSASGEVTMGTVRTLYPAKMCEPGFYSLMRATGETFTHNEEPRP
jgi:hypothetical protein